MNIFSLVAVSADLTFFPQKVLWLLKNYYFAWVWSTHGQKPFRKMATTRAREWLWQVWPPERQNHFAGKFDSCQSHLPGTPVNRLQCLWRKKVKLFRFLQHCIFTCLMSMLRATPTVNCAAVHCKQTRLLQCLVVLGSSPKMSDATSEDAGDFKFIKYRQRPMIIHGFASPYGLTNVSDVILTS